MNEVAYVLLPVFFGLFGFLAGSLCSAAWMLQDAPKPRALNVFPDGVVLPEPDDPRWAKTEPTLLALGGVSVRLGIGDEFAGLIHVDGVSVYHVTNDITTKQVEAYCNAVRAAFVARRALAAIQDAK